MNIFSHSPRIVMQGPGWSALGDGYYMALRVRGSPPTDIWFAYSVRFGRDALTSRTGDFFLFASRNTMAHNNTRL